MPTIPISDGDPKNTYTATGGQTIFPYTFWVKSNTHIAVYVNGTLKALTTDYTVSAVQEPTGANIVFNSGLVVDDKVVILYDPAFERTAEYTGTIRLEALNTELTYLLTLLQSNQRKIDDAIKTADAEVESFSGQLPSLTGNGDKVLKIKSDLSGIEYGATSTEIEAAAANAATATAQAVIATAQATTATTQAGNATSQATLAQGYANDAAAALSGVAFNDVVFVTNADSPVTLDQDDAGKFFSVDTSGGAVVINLPEISGLTLPYNVTISKTTIDGSTVTVNRGGSSDEIEGSSSKVQQNIGGFTAIADTDGSPDSWTLLSFGAAAGDMTVDVFTDGSGYTGDVSTAITLSSDPGSENNTWVYFDGVYQEKSEYSVSGSTMTFTQAISSGLAKVEVMFGTTLSVGTPSDGTVTEAKMASSAVTFDKVNSSAIASQAEAEAGTAADKLMTPQRTAQAIASKVAAATAAEVKAETADKVVEADLVKHNRGVAKASGTIDGTGTPSIDYDHNVASIVDISTGNYTINLDVTMADTNYAVTTCSVNTGFGGVVVAITARTTTSFTVILHTNGPTPAPVDATFFFAVYGDLA